MAENAMPQAEPIPQHEDEAGRGPEPSQHQASAASASSQDNDDVSEVPPDPNDKPAAPSSDT